MWQIIHLHACQHDRLCNPMHAYVSHDATVCMPVWQTKHRMPACVADYKLCSRVCCCMHTCVTDYPNVFMPIWQIQPMQQRMHLHAYLGCKVRTCINAGAADTACVVEYATTCPACMHVWQITQPHVWHIMQLHACKCSK